jgi:hypothetical protein
MTHATYVVRKRETNDMKQALYISAALLVFLPGLGLAQDLTQQGAAIVALNKQVSGSEQTFDNRQRAGAASADNSTLTLNAYRIFVADPSLYSSTKQVNHSDVSVIGDWRERIFKSLGEYVGPREQDLMNSNRLLSNSQLDNQENEGKTVTKLVMKETLKYAQEQMPEIDKLVKALRFEISNRPTEEHSGVEESVGVLGDQPAVKKKLVEDKFIIKSGLRVRVDSGNLGVISETEAKYSNVSYFYKVSLDNHSDNSLGLTYVLSRDLYVQVERAFSGTINPTSDKPNRNLIQLGCKF